MRCNCLQADQRQGQNEATPGDNIGASDIAADTEAEDGAENVDDSRDSAALVEQVCASCDWSVLSTPFFALFRRPQRPQHVFPDHSIALRVATLSCEITVIDQSSVTDLYNLRWALTLGFRQLQTGLVVSI